jgi:hypothetical protein
MLRDLNRAALTPPLRPAIGNRQMFLGLSAYSILARSVLLSE